MSNGKRGSALLTVLWLTAALAAIGLAVASNVRGESERTASGVDDTKAELEARGGVERAAMRMLWSRSVATPDGQPLFWRYGVPFMDFSFPGAEVHVDVIPEASKLDLNTLPPEPLARLLLLLGMPEDRALETTAAIVDWRTSLEGGRQSPFDAFYLSRTPSFLARHASFFENEELLLVKGITPELYYGSTLPPGPKRTALRDCVSVYGGAGVDINTAEPVVLQTIGLSPEEINAIVGLRRVRPVTDGQQLRAVQQSLSEAGRMLRYGGVSMYTLKATARLRQPDGRLSDMRRTTAALVKFDFPGGKRNFLNYEVIRWYDRY